MATIIERIKQLTILQEIDQEIAVIEEFCDAFPRTRALLEDEIKKKTAAVDLAKKELTRVRLQLREKETELKGIEEGVSKLQKSLDSLNSNKEYTAMLTEIASLKQKASACEDDILILMEKSDQMEKKEHLLQKAYETEKEEIETRLRNEGEKLASEGLLLAEKKIRREERRKEADASDYAIYERVRKGKKDGVAVCVMEGDVGNESCTGCYMHVPTYLIEKVKKKQEIVTCENCSRILY